MTQELVNLLYNLNTESVFYILRTIKKDSHIKTTQVFDKDGKLINDGTDKLLSSNQLLSSLIVSDISKLNARKYLVIGNEIIITCPIFLETDKLGFLKFKYSLEFIPSDVQDIEIIISSLSSQAKENTLQAIFFFAIIFLPVSFAIALALSNQLTKPILELSVIAEKFGIGQDNFIFPKKILTR